MENFEPINVDFLINSDKVKADSQKVKADIVGVDQTAAKSAKNVSATVKRVYDQNVKEVNEYTNAVTNSTKATTAAGNAAVAAKPKWNGLGNSINQMSREAPAFAVSAQTGFLALSNNIPIFADEINKLRVANQALTASGQKAVPVWRQVAKSLFGWGTALSLGVTLLTIYGKEVGQFIGRLFKGKGAIDSMKESQLLLNKAFESTDYGNAIKDVLSLETNIDLAKKGMIDAKDVVEQYNESLGKATGSVKDLNEVEQSMIANADKYIQMMLYKSAANLALDEAAKSAYESARTQQQEEKKLEDLRDKIARKRASGDTEMSVGRGSRSEFASAIDEEKRVQKALEKLRDDGEKAITERNDIFKKLQAKAASFGLDMFLNQEDDKTKTAASSKGNNAAKERQRLLDRIAEVDKEYARKKMEDDEAEVQALRDKFAKIEQLIERFNEKNPGIAIPINQLKEIGANAEAELIKRQQEKKTEAIRTEAEAARELYEKNWQKQLDDLRDYETERNRLIQEYQALRLKLVNQGYTKEAAELDRQHTDELGALDDAQLKKVQSYKDLFEGINGLSISAGQTVIENAKKLIATQEMSAEAKADILKKIAEAENLIQNTKFQNIAQLADAFWDLGDALKNLGDAVGSNGLSSAGSALSGLASGMRNVLTVFDESSSKTDKIAAGINGVVQMVTMLATAAAKRKEAEQAYYMSVIGFQRDYNLALQDQIRLEGELRDSAFINDYEGKLESGIAALQNANEEYNKALAGLNDGQVKIGQRDGIDWGNVGKGASAGAAIGALAGSFVPVIGTAIGAVVGAIGGAIAGLFGGKKKDDVFGSLLTEYPELIQTSADGIQTINTALAESLISQGLLNAETQATLENILKWQDAIEEARTQIREVISELAGSLSSGLKDSLVEAFKNGEDAAIAMGKTVEDVLEGILAQLIFNQIFSQAFEQLQEQMAASYDVGGDGNWTDDFAAFFESASALSDDFNAALEQAKAEAAGFGFDIFKPDGEGQQGGLQGALRREMTEATASELTGLYRGTYDVMKRQLNTQASILAINQRNMRFTMMIMESNALIERNTAQTVVSLSFAVTQLKEIATNTKEQSGRDLGI